MKIDGVKVGTVGSVTPTPQAQAAVVLKIENPGFQDFRADASCTIEPEALLGEKFVNCLPTQPRAEGTPLPPPLHKIPSGQEGAGEFLLPVTNTSSPVDVDLLNDINRLPVRERFTIIINELGAGLAGRGSDLNVVVKRADPALREFDKVLAILAGENKLLAKLSVDSDQGAGAVRRRARTRRRLHRAEQHGRDRHRQAPRRARARTSRTSRPSCSQFGPAMERFGKFADETTPAFTDLKAAAPGINETFTNLRAVREQLDQVLHEPRQTAQVSGPAIAATAAAARTRAEAGQRRQAVRRQPLRTASRACANTGGLERLLDLIFLGGGSLNGYDSLGHFLRAEIIAKNCVGYKVAPQGGCSANFVKGTEGSAGLRKPAPRRRRSPTSLVMDRTLAVLKGATPAQAIAKYPGPVPTLGVEQRRVRERWAPKPGPASTAQPVGGASAGTTYYTPSAESSGASGMLLNYLLGN